MSKYLSFSRPLMTADRLGEMAIDRHRFLDKSVLLTGEAATLSTENGRSILLQSLRLIPRICPNLTVLLPNSEAHLLDEAHALAAKVEFGEPVRFDSSADPEHFDAVLSVGSEVRPKLPWTAVNANGWLARVSSCDIALPHECGAPNAIGALGAACLGVGEVFKRLIGLSPARGALANGMTFSLLTLEDGVTDPGPPLPSNISSDLLVVGAGALGNGIVDLLCNLPVSGQIQIVDRQKFSDENLGTCMLIGPNHLGKSKAEVMAEMLRVAGKNAYGFEGEFTAFARTLSSFPRIVLNGVDNIEARHEVQRTFWADLTIDGAISDFGCQVSRHPWSENVACLICLFRMPNKSAEQIATEASGLTAARVQQADEVVTIADVIAAPDSRRDYLESNLGRRICSVVSEAVAQKISDEKQAEGFEPSVPFVAAFSACMVVAQMVVEACGWKPVLEPRFQFDFLQGPENGVKYPQERRGDCECQRRKNIERFRASHR